MVRLFWNSITSNYCSLVVTNVMKFVKKLNLKLVVCSKLPVPMWTYTPRMSQAMHEYIILCQRPSEFIINEICKIAIRSHSICCLAVRERVLTALVLNGWLVATAGHERWPLAAITCILKYILETMAVTAAMLWIRQQHK